jgi:hypothetical protein
MSIEKQLLPDLGKLKIKKGVATARILDEELDVLKCSFLNDGCVNISTRGYTYIVLSESNLKELIKLIRKADKYYKSEL